MSLGVLAFIGGCLLMDALVRRAPPQPLVLVEDDAATAARAKRETRGLVMISAAILIPSWVYFVLLGEVPLFMGVTDVVNSGYGGLGALQTYRLALTPHLTGESIPFKGLFDIARNYGTLFIVGVSTVQLLQKRGKALRIVLIVASVITGLAAGQRWPMIYLVVTALAAIYALARFGLRPRGRRVFGFSVALIAVGMVITLLQKRTTEVIDNAGSALSFVFENLYERIVFEQSATPILSFQRHVFAAGELEGASYWQAIQANLPGSDINNFEVDFFARVYGGHYGYTAAPGFFTEAYINFGFLGVVLLSLLWGMLLTRVDNAKWWDSDLAFRPGFKSAVVALLAGTTFAGGGLLIGGTVLFVYVLILYRLVAGGRAREEIGPAHESGRAAPAEQYSRTRSWTLKSSS
ncbi:O-antigen polymerase [Microbacterium sp. NPDC057659]|uniref:O-antigen polymerase n=1 Tax=Microbacterium sp. NPDC057659 TaxID=3346198 RepID=UPI00366B63D4